MKINSEPTPWEFFDMVPQEDLQYGPECIELRERFNPKGDIEQAALRFFEAGWMPNYAITEFRGLRVQYGDDGHCWAVPFKIRRWIFRPKHSVN